MYGVVVGGCLYVADHTEGDGETILWRHHGELQLQGVVFAVGIVHEYVVEGVAILTDFHYLQTETLLYESELIVLTEHELLAVLHIDGVLLTALVVIDDVVTVVVEDDAVLQHLSDGGSLVLVGSLQYIWRRLPHSGRRSVRGHRSTVLLGGKDPPPYRKDLT